MSMQWFCARLTPILFAFACVANAGVGQAQLHSVSVQAPRPAGWMTGDIIPLRMQITIDSALPLQRASLPKPGPINYWLELRNVDVLERTVAGTTEYTVALDYQTFYVPLDVNTREIPAVALSFGQGPDVLEVRNEPWSFTMSPLRGVLMRDAAKSPLAMRPDAEAQLLSAKGAMSSAAVFAVASMLLVVVLAWHYAAWPFRARPARPFAKAWRDVRFASREGSPQAYRQALLRLHRAFDAAAGKRLMAADVPQFLVSHPAFSNLNQGMTNFFRASHWLFFANDDSRAMESMPWQSLSHLAASLAAVERGAL